MKKWLKEPLLHFLLLGALIFLLYSQTNPSEDSDYKIVIDDDKINHINALWELQWKREPTQEELKGLIDNYIRQEIMYQEALRLNLDHNDEIVKRRLSQKMEFMANDLTKLIEPATEEKLQRYFDRNKEKYKIPTSYSFKHITFNRSNHSDPKKFAETVLAKADVFSKDALDAKGDDFMIPSEFENSSKFEIIRTIGESFYTALENQPLNRWIGPISSGFGEHLVFISEKENAHISDFKEVLSEVKRDYEYEIESTTKETIYQELKKKYTVVFDSEKLTKDQEVEISANLNPVE